MRTLIWSQVHLRNVGQGLIFGACQELIRRLNPEADLLVIDNASPVDPEQFVAGDWAKCNLRPMSEIVPLLEPGAHVGAKAPALVRYHESLGHFFHGHTHGRPVRDGPGRAHSLALRMAEAAGYDRACYIEADCLFRRPVGPIMDAMTKPVGCQRRIDSPAYGYLDWHVWPIADMAWLKAFDFVSRYDWKNRVGEPGGERPGEYVYEDIFGDHLEVLPIDVVRGDVYALTAANLNRLFPRGVDGLTHVPMDCFALALRQWGFVDIAEGLVSGLSAAAD